MKVHAIQTGTLRGNRTFLQGEGFGSLVRRPEPYEFPVLSFVVEHPEGLIAIDTGLGTVPSSPPPMRRFVPSLAASGPSMAGQIRALGLDPEDVRRVVLTHLDWDHAGGVGDFPHAEVLVHRPEHAFAQKRMGRARYHPELWPAGFDPVLYDLVPEPFGPFPATRAVTGAGDVRVVPLPGHSIGQVGVVVEAGGALLLFSADHMLRLDWFAEDRPVQLGAFFRREAIETSRRIARLAADRETLILPSHDAETPARLRGALRPVAVAA